MSAFQVPEVDLAEPDMLRKELYAFTEDTGLSYQLVRGQDGKPISVTVSSSKHTASELAQLWRDRARG